MPTPQTLKNHAKIDPRFHFFAAPVLLLNVVVTVILAIRYWPQLRWLGIWGIFVAAALFMTVALARMYGLANQDRLIRIEERLRYAVLLSPDQQTRVAGLSLRQIIALRFASDAELPALALRATAENLDAKQIKQSIQTWRADTSRV